MIQAQNSIYPPNIGGESGEEIFKKGLRDITVYGYIYNHKEDQESFFSSLENGLRDPRNKGTLNFYNQRDKEIIWEHAPMDGYRNPFKVELSTEEGQKISYHIYGTHKLIEQIEYEFKYMYCPERRSYEAIRVFGCPLYIEKNDDKYFKIKIVITDLFVSPITCKNSIFSDKRSVLIE